MTRHTLGIDPGPTTGIAVLAWSDDGTRVDTGGSLFLQVPADEAARWVRVVATAKPEYAQIEGWAHGRGKGHTARATRTVIGEVETELDDADVPYVALQAGNVKPWATNQRLRVAGLLRATLGQPHARDGARHALYVGVRRCGMTDPLDRHEAEEKAADDRDVRRRMGEP